MNDEIKEILDRIEIASEIFDCLLKPEECTELLDYITNLQQENERLKEQLFDFKQHIYIQKSGIPQKLTQDKTFMELYDMPTYEDYKSRCEKAIEYIKEKARNNCWIDQYEASDLITILQNGSDSQ